MFRNTTSSLMSACDRASDCAAQQPRIESCDATGLNPHTHADGSGRGAGTEAGVADRVRTRGAGPRTTLPWKLYCEPWQGHMNLFSFCSTAPAC